ncbi:hypothetical protein ACQ4LE_001660 [Meloidogyne hapla]
MRGEDPDGCRPCCNLIGNYGNEGCDKVIGKCACKALVMREQCDHLLQELYGLSADDPNGCKPCYCDPGGTYDNQMCYCCRCAITIFQFIQNLQVFNKKKSSDFK